MKRRLVSIAAALAVLFTAILPMTAFAANPSSKTLNLSTATYQNVKNNGSAEIGGDTGVKATPVSAPQCGRVKFEGVYVNTFAYPYIAVEYYFDNPNNASTMTKMGMLAFSRNKNNTDDTTGLLDPSSADNGGRLQEAAIESNKWATAVFDFSSFNDWMDQTFTARASIRSLWLLPFGSWTTNTNTLQNNETIYIKSVTVYDTKPETGDIFYDSEGKVCAAVSEQSDTVTVDGVSYKAFGSINSAMTKFGNNDGIIYISGDITKFEDVDARGSVTLRGIGDTAEDIDANRLVIGNKEPFMEIKGGDLALDYMTIQAAPNTNGEYGIFSNGKTITFGSKLNVEKNEAGQYLYVGFDGATKEVKADTVYFNGGSFTSVVTGTNYGGIAANAANRHGTTNYFFNNGYFETIMAGSKDGSDYGISATYGDVNYTFNGGTYNGQIVLGSAYHTSLTGGNILFTVNGGIMRDINITSGNLGYNGGSLNNTANNNSAGTKWSFWQRTIPNTAVVVNNAKLDENDDISTLTIGNDGKGLSIAGKEIYIINNYEKNTGTKINEKSSAPYKIHVYNGTAEPVYDTSAEYGGELLGFSLTSDAADTVPCLNGQVLEAGENGLYTIPENETGITNIVFAQAGVKAGVLNFSAGTANGKINVNAGYFSYEEPSSLILAAAEYDKTTKQLINVYIDTAEISGVEALSVSGALQSEDNIFKAFLWNSSTMKPYSQALDF